MPNNLSGCVHITDINPAFTSLLEQEEENNESSSILINYFPVGTILKCVVISTDSNKHGHSKIRLSINPEELNSSLTPNSIYPNMVMCSYVASIEDHGYAVDFGVKNIKGFLLKSNITGRFGRAFAENQEKIAQVAYPPSLKFCPLFQISYVSATAVNLLF